MTKDRALRVLDVYASVNGSGQCTQDEFEEAKKMAIEALESQDRQVIIAGSYLLEGEDNVPDTNVGDIISRQAAIEALSTPHGILYPIRTIESLPSAQPERTCVNCGRTANNGGWYADGGTRCPIEEHYALPKDGYCHLWEKRNVTDDDYPEGRADE